MSTAYVELKTGLILKTSYPENWTEGTRLSIKKGKEKLREQAKVELLKTLKRGDTVYTVLRHVSRSGMFRRIDLYKLTNDGPIYLSSYAGDLMGWSVNDMGGTPGVATPGCGMDMGFHLVYGLSNVLFEDGYALKQRWL